MSFFFFLLQEEGFLIIKVDDLDLIEFGPEYFVVFCLATGLSCGVAIAVSFLLYYQVNIGHSFIDSLIPSFI